jgi:hypothetical protein
VRTGGARVSGIPPIETALALSRGQLTAGQSHGFKNLFVLESGLLVRPLSLFGQTGRVLLAGGPIVANFLHCNPDWVNLTALLPP